MKQSRRHWEDGMALWDSLFFVGENWDWFSEEEEDEIFIALVLWVVILPRLIASTNN